MALSYIWLYNIVYILKLTKAVVFKLPSNPAPISESSCSHGICCRWNRLELDYALHRGSRGCSPRSVSKSS